MLRFKKDRQNRPLQGPPPLRSLFRAQGRGGVLRLAGEHLCVLPRLRNTTRTRVGDGAGQGRIGHARAAGRARVAVQFSRQCCLCMLRAMVPITGNE